MPDVDDVAVFDDVVFAFDEKAADLFELHFGGMARLRRGFGGQAFRGGGEFAILHHFGADEAFGDVAVDRVRGFDGGRALPDVPGADFVFAGGEEGNVAERLVELAGENVQ